MPEINPKQITFARVRRRLTKAQLAKELEARRVASDGNVVPLMSRKGGARE